MRWVFFSFLACVFQEDKNESLKCDRAKLQTKKLQFSTRYKIKLFS